MLKRLVSSALPIALGAALLLTSACGGDDDDASPDPAGPDGAGAGAQQTAAAELEGDPDLGACAVTFTGDTQVEISGDGGPAAAGTDYWLSDDELRQVVEQLARVTSADKTDEEIEREVDETMASSEPKLFVLILNCSDREDSDRSISILASGSSTYDDIPFGAGTYPIPASSGESKPGTFSVLFNIDEKPYRVSSDGELDITKFDASGIAGTFSFRAEEMFATPDAKTISVDGSFDFDCTGGAVCEGG